MAGVDGVDACFAEAVGDAIRLLPSGDGKFGIGAPGGKFLPHGQAAADEYEFHPRPTSPV